MGSSHAPGIVFLLIIQFGKPEFINKRIQIKYTILNNAAYRINTEMLYPTISEQQNCDKSLLFPQLIYSSSANLQSTLF